MFSKKLQKIFPYAMYVIVPCLKLTTFFKLLYSYHSTAPSVVCTHSYCGNWCVSSCDSLVLFEITFVFICNRVHNMLVQCNNIIIPTWPYIGMISSDVYCHLYYITLLDIPTLHILCLSFAKLWSTLVLDKKGYCLGALHYGYCSIG